MDPDFPEKKEPENMEKGNFMKSAEARMVLYIVPVAVVFIIAALVLSQCGGG
jgi:hypothetical protein